MLGYPVQGKDAAKHLLILCQRSCSVAEYSLKFRTLAANLGWNDESLQVVFLNGLSDQVKDKSVKRDDTDTFDPLIS